MFGAWSSGPSTVSPIDGRVGWTVVDGAYVEHERAAEYLRVLVDGEGRSVGTARAYAGRLALYLSWAEKNGDGVSFDDWRSRVRQPTSRLTLSLRGLPELVRLEFLYALQRGVGEKVRATPEAISTFVDELRSTRVRSVLDFDRVSFDRKHNSDKGRLARFTLDRVALAYRDPETEVTGDRWDMRVFSRPGELDFTPIRQGWLRRG